MIVPSDSGKVSWWSEDGDKVTQCSNGLQDTVVHIDLSLSGNGLWICGFSSLAFFNIERSEEGGVFVVSEVLSQAALSLAGLYIMQGLQVFWHRT